MVQRATSVPFQWERDIHFEAEGSLSEIIFQLKRSFLPSLTDADLDQPVRVVFTTEPDSEGSRLAFRNHGGLEQALWQFKRGFLDQLSGHEFRRKGVLKILRDRKVIQPNPDFWAAPQEDLYLGFFGLEENPFAQTPNPRFFYASPIHAEAISRLTYAINRKRGFALITGEIGSGKTIVCRTALRSVKRRARIALITSTFLTRNELLIALCEEFDVEPSRRRKINFLRALQHYLIEQYQRDRLVVVVLDEAQNLSPPVLEEVRMLSNLETDEEKLIQIVFLGQPELAHKIDTPELEQLRQRIAVRYHLCPLDLPETKRYIEHRLGVAGAGKVRFSEGACAKIHEHTGGIPRLINAICETCLLVAYGRGRGEITEDIVLAAKLDLEGKSGPGTLSQLPKDNLRPESG
jgi:type II secretory pathway predicted ATPase ExeA